MPRVNLALYVLRLTLVKFTPLLKQIMKTMYYTTKQLRQRYEAIRSEGAYIVDKMNGLPTREAQQLNKLALQCASFEEFMQRLPSNVQLTD